MNPENKVMADLYNVAKEALNAKTIDSSSNDPLTTNSMYSKLEQVRTLRTLPDSTINSLLNDLDEL